MLQKICSHATNMAPPTCKGHVKTCVILNREQANYLSMQSLSDLVTTFAKSANSLQNGHYKMAAEFAEI